VRRGRFITFEGGEGVGKSTHAARLAEWLRGTGIDVVLTREPGGSPAAEAIRTLLLGGRARRFGAEAEALLFALARADHVEETIAPALRAGSWVVSDRFLDSTRAYQGPAGVPKARIEELERIAVGEFRPDLTLLLDAPVSDTLGRLRRRGGEGDRFEAEAASVQEARRRAFLALAVAEPERIVVIDAARDPADVARDVRSAVIERFGQPGGT